MGARVGLAREAWKAYASPPDVWSATQFLLGSQRNQAPPMDDPSVIHVPVLLGEIVQTLDVRPGAVVVDGTLGGGGHTRAIAERVGANGLVVALDRDPGAVAAAEQNLAGLPIKLLQGNYCDLPEILAELGIRAVDGVVLDLGLSSDQLADMDRGFSFASEGPLDLRFDPSRGVPAWRLMERLSAEHLADLIYAFGEERFSRRIARAVVERRHDDPIRTAAQLADLVRRCVPQSKGHRIDPATRTFQALRIAVNDELKSLDTGLRRIPECLCPGGRMAVISFHSLEDRRVKESFRTDVRLDVITKKPIVPGPEETDRNPRARSAKLRVAMRRQDAG